LKNEVGGCVSSCPESSPAPQGTEAAPKSDDVDHFVDFKFAIESGQPIEDETGFTLIHPDGSKEKGTLSQGEFTRDGVPEGVYRMKFKHIEDCGWRRDTAVGEPRVAMLVKTKNFPNGTEVVFDVFRRFATRLKPRFTKKAKLRGNHACATFAYKQGVGETAGGEFVFTVKIGKKEAFSNVLTIRRFPLDVLAGVQQRLKELGIDPGPTDGIYGSLTQKAVRAFQERNPELKLDGIPGPLTKRELSLSI
jgi:putative peptidoglycan binding protein